MNSLRNHEGYFLLDHSMSPGITDALAVASGLPIGVGRQRFEAATYTCSHCERVVVIEPKRTRDRAYCSRCDHLICDGCGAAKAAGEPCYPFKARAYDLIDEAIKKSTLTEAIPTLIIP